MILTIGLEIHVELNTKSKVFCSCSTEISEISNKNICEICTGQAGALPKLNKAVVFKGVELAKALNCDINEISMFDRKNYFYPDLPKGYQITQFFKPYAENGFLEYYSESKILKAEIERIHIEEDAGKLTHIGEFTEVDLNRAGVPLLEIVTKPCFKSAKSACDFLKSLRQVLKYTNVSDCKMEEGSIRVDVNVSLSENDELGTRVEMKNLNSFSAVFDAINYEEKRQRELLKNDKKIERQTRRWDVNKSVVLREKENDYKFIRDFNFLPLKITEQMILNIKTPKLPFKRLEKYVKEYNFTVKNAEILISEMEISDFFDELVEVYLIAPKEAFNYISTDILKYLNKTGNKLQNTKITTEIIAKLIKAVNDDKIARNNVYSVINEMMSSDKTLQETIDSMSLNLISDENILEKVVQDVLLLNDRAVIDYKNGNTKVLGFLIASCKERNKGLDPKLLSKIIKNSLENINGGNYE